jgi:conjugative relaxase-like TrwC/TraI family protein
MLKFTPLTARGTDKDGHSIYEYLKATEYYIGADGEEQDISQWVGQGAEVLGLSGTVDIATLEQLGRGFSPDGKTALCQNAGELGDGQKDVGHRVGWDMTFSAPKDVSILMADADPEEREKIIAVHRDAVAFSMNYLEQFAQTRSGKEGCEIQGTKGLVAASFTHFGSRDLDPQLHQHVLVLNVVQGQEDGHWRTLETGQMYHQKKAAMALYHAGLDNGMQKLGYSYRQEREVDADGRETGQVWGRIQGVPESLCDERSKRRAAILEYQAQHGGSLQDATMKTRKHKDEPSFAELSSIWKEEFKVSREQDPTLYRSTRDLKGLNNELLEITDEGTLKRLHANSAKFDRSDLIARLALENRGRMSPQEVLKEADAFLLRNNLIELDDRSKQHRMDQPQTEWAAKWMVDMELQIGQRGVARRDDETVRLKPATVVAAIRDFEKTSGYKLSDEQKFSIDWATRGSGGTCCLSGWAGTGKTATAAVWIDAFKREGFEVLGVSTGWDAADKLQSETGIQSRSAASMLAQLDNGKLKLTNKSVVVFDEGGMAGTETIAKLQQYCDQAKAKFVVMGDHLQLQPIQAGAPFRLLVDEIGHAQLKEVRRQRSEEDRKTTRLLYQEGSFALGSQVMERLDEQKQISRHETRPKAIEQIANDYMASARPAREKIVIGGTLAEVRLLNEAIRDRLQDKGEVGRDEATFRAKAGGQWSELTLGQRDRIRFSGKERLRCLDPGKSELEVVNGLHGVVQDIKPTKTGSYQITVRTESDSTAKDGRLVQFDTAEFKSLTRGLATTTHKSQGQGKEEVYHLASPEMGDQHLQLVAFTRTKDRYRMYGTPEDLETMEKRVGLQRLKTNAIEQLPKGELASAAIQLPEHTRQGPSFKERLEAVRGRKKGMGMGIGL